MKYKLINRQTGEEHLCEKVTMDDFDYYVSECKIKVGDYIQRNNEKPVLYTNDFWFDFGVPYKKVIATNNPSIDAPQVVDEAEQLAKELIHSEGIEVEIVRTVWINGYKKSQEEHPFSEEDIRFMLSEAFKASQEGYQITADEIIQIWKEQQPKVIYYNTITQ